MMRQLAERTSWRSKALWLLAVALMLGTSVQDTDARTADQRPRASTLRVAVLDAVGLPDGVRRALRDELRRLLRPHRIGVEEVDVQEYADEVSGRGGATDIVKVLILPRDGGAWGVGADAMGGAPPAREPRACDALYVFHPVILGALRGSGRGNAEPTRLELGRAIGRVIVHELVHTLAPQHPHADRGVMADALGRPQLTGPARVLDVASARALRRGLEARSGTS